MRRKPEIVRDIKWGLIWSYATAFVLCGIAAIMLKADPDPTAEAELELVVVSYLLGAAAVGVILGIGRPWVGSLLGSIAVAMLAAIPVGGIVLLLMIGGPQNWTSSETILLFGYALIGGPVIGAAVRQAVRNW